MTMGWGWGEATAVFCEAIHRNSKSAIFILGATCITLVFFQNLHLLGQRSAILNPLIWSYDNLVFVPNFSDITRNAPEPNSLCFLCCLEFSNTTHFYNPDSPLIIEKNWRNTGSCTDWREKDYDIGEEVKSISAENYIVTNSWCWWKLYF